MKKLIYAFGIMMSLALASTAFADDSVKLNIDGKAIETDVAPQIIDNRTMVPVRAIFEGVGANVDWDSDTKTITGSMLGINVVMVLNSNVVTVDGKEVTMDCAPVVIDGRTLAPARYVAEAFGCSVEWDNENKAVNIATPISAVLDKVTTNATTVATTETTTETTTAEVVTHPMQNFETYYKSGTYKIGKDIPAGEYMLYANPGVMAYMNYYATNGVNRTGIQNGYFDYCRAVKLVAGNEISITGGYAIPREDTVADLSRNGTFAVGTDIKEGHLTFKLGDGVHAGYVEVGIEGMPASSKTIEYLNKDNSSVIINVKKGSYVKMVGCDVLDEYLKPIAKHTLNVDNNNKTDEKINFAEITPDVKRTVDDHMTKLSTQYSINSLSDYLYNDLKYRDVVNKWNDIAKNDADRKYIELAKNLYDQIKVIAKSTRTDIAFANAISMNGKEVSGIQYREIIDGEKDMVVNAVNIFEKASDFKTIEMANYNVRSYRYQVPRVNGSRLR